MTARLVIVDESRSVSAALVRSLTTEPGIEIENTVASVEELLAFRKKLYSNPVTRDRVMRPSKSHVISSSAESDKGASAIAVRRSKGLSTRKALQGVG